MPQVSDRPQTLPLRTETQGEPRRRRRWVPLAATAFAGAAIGAGLTWWVERPPAVVLPSASASVEQVAVAYLANWAGGRCDTLDALSAPDRRTGCGGVTLLGYRNVGTAEILRPPETAQVEHCVPAEINSNGSADGSFPSGWQPWSLCFAQTTHGWRLVDAGQG